MTRRTDPEVAALIKRQVLFRNRMAKKYSDKSIGERFGIHPRTIAKIIKRLQLLETVCCGEKEWHEKRCVSCPMKEWLEVEERIKPPVTNIAQICAAINKALVRP